MYNCGGVGVWADFDSSFITYNCTYTGIIACPIGEIVLYCRYGKTIEPGGFTPLIFRRVQSSPPDEGKEGDAMYVTYADLIQM